MAPVPSKVARLVAILAIISAFSVASGYMIFTVEGNATATIVQPRFGHPARGPVTAGPGLNRSTFLNESITVWVGPDPVESPVPLAWLDAANWAVALVPSVMPSANCTPLVVESVHPGINQDVLFGGGMDVNPIFPTALGITCTVPGDIPPVLHDLVIGFKTPLTVEGQRNGSVDMVARVGDWRGPRGSASQNPVTGNQPFVLKEKNAVSFPWIHDARSADASGKIVDGNAVQPFTVMHVTDTHYYNQPNTWMAFNDLWEVDASVIAPDVIVLSGDVMEHNEKPEEAGAYQYELARARLGALHLPVIMLSGNHDNYNLGPWRHYFGPLFSASRVDDLTIVAFDSTLPIGPGILQWIDARSNPATPGAPVLLSCHYNPDPSYFQSGWMGIGTMMIRKGTTAILTGHTHTDLVGSIPRLHQALHDNLAFLLDYSMRQLVELLEQALANQSYDDPLLLNTRSIAKRSGVVLNPFGNATLDYPGYRILTFTGNAMSNFTYDHDGDGTRDPQISFPSGMFRVERVSDPGLGTDPAANATWALNNTGTESLRTARAIFELPAPPASHAWALDSASVTAGAWMRASITNGTHWWFDIRVPASKNAVTTVRLTPVVA